VILGDRQKEKDCYPRCVCDCDTRWRFIFHLR